MAVTVTALLVAALVVWLLGRRCRRRASRPRTSAHLHRGRSEGVSVAELLEKTKEPGNSVQLHWSDRDLDEPSLMRPYVQDQFPTVIMPPVIDDEE